MIKHYRNLILLPLLASLVACESDPTPSVLVDSDKIRIEVRNTAGTCSELSDANALEISLFEGDNNLRLFGNDKLSLIIDGLPLEIVETAYHYLTGGESYCYLADLTDTGLDGYSLSEHLVELQYSRGTQQNYINTLVFPDVVMEFSDSSATVQPFSAQLLLDDALSSPEFFSGRMLLKSAESDEQQALCLFNDNIYKDDISADAVIELNLHSVTQACETGTYTVSDDSEVVLQYKYVMDNIEGLESVTTIARSTIAWPFASFTYNN